MRTNHITSPPVSAPYVHHHSSDIAGADGNTMTPRDHVDQQASPVYPDNMDQFGGAAVTS